MRRFKEGQKVICRHPTGMWLGVFPGPFFNDVVTVSKYSSIHQGYIELCEYPNSNIGNHLPDCYGEIWFEPLSEINELEAILEQQTQEA